MRIPILATTACALLPTQSAFAQSCTKGGVVAPCEYPPIVDDFGPVANQTGLDDGRPPQAGDPAGDILRRVTLVGDGTVNPTCNDGSPAVMYIRPAGPGGGDKWVFVLEGGSPAFNTANGLLDQSMWRRWTGGPTPQSPLDWVKKTSTDFSVAGAPGRDGIVDLPFTLVLGGVLSSALNSSSFRNWNWVYLNYCSSDNWTGRTTGLELPLDGMWTDGGVVKTGFKADFNGHQIIEAALIRLRDVSPVGTDANPQFAMPPLNNASTVLLVGESSGGAGVAHNLDWVEATLAATNPTVSVMGSIGANLRPPIGVLGVDPWGFDNNLDGVDDIQGGLQLQWSQVQQIDGFVDQSCAANLADWRCLHVYEITTELTAPHMVKQDMGDATLRDRYPSPAAYFAGLEAAFADFELAGTPYFGPFCGTHDSVTHAEYFDDVLDVRLAIGPNNTPVGPPLLRVDYDDALFDFANGGSPSLRHGELLPFMPNIWDAACL